MARAYPELDAAAWLTVAAATDVFGGSVVVRLFGSRADDAQRGGDIDLYLEAEAGQGTLEKQLAFEAALQETLGEQRIDVVLHERGQPYTPIDRIALDTGVEL